MRYIKNLWFLLILSMSPLLQGCGPQEVVQVVQVLPLVIDAARAVPLVINVAKKVTTGVKEHTSNNENNLRRSTTVASSLTSSSLKNETNYKICNQALSLYASRWDDKNAYFRLRVDEAQSRGLSVEDCARILGRSTIASRIEKQRIEEEANRERERLALVEADRIKEAERLRKEEIARKVQDKEEALKAARLAELERKRKEKIAQERRAREAVKLERDRKEAAEAKRLAAIERKREKLKAKKLEVAKLKHQNAIAVIIGNRDYKGDTPDVEFAVNDADAMKFFVLNKLGYRPGNIIDLRDATQAELLATFGSQESYKGKLFDYVRANASDVIVFYSGHGGPGMSDKRGYLLSVDADPTRAELTGYPVDTLLTNLSKIPAKSMTVFIDACFSGNTPKGMLVDAISGLTVEIRQPKKTNKGMVVLTASRGDQVASWDKNAKHGLFTKHLLEALNGAADKQSKTGNKDGKVTLGEVKAYLDREMTYQARRRFSRDQHATVSGDLKTVLSAY
jgi:hypothetical protein